MNQQSLKAYLNLIQQLLDCPKGEEWTLLQQHEDLLNPELLQIMTKVAAELVTEGNQQAAKFLRHWEGQIAPIISQKVPPQNEDDKSQAYLQLIQALLSCPKGSEGEVLAKNQELIDPSLVQIMKQVASQMIAQGDRESASFLSNLAADLGNRLAMLHPNKLHLEKHPHPQPIPLESDNQKLETLNQLLSQLQENLVTKAKTPEPPSERVAPSVPLETAIAKSIDDRLAVISDTLVKLTNILASEKISNPLWYMDVLEQACQANWILSTEEVEKLIGVEPKCLTGQNIFQRGCWVFVKVGKIGSQTAWKVTKINPTQEEVSAPIQPSEVQDFWTSEEGENKNQ